MVRIKLNLNLLYCVTATLTRPNVCLHVFQPQDIGEATANGSAIVADKKTD